MNGLEIFIIPLIALAVWVLQYIFRGPEENKPANRSRPSGQPRPANRPPQRRPVTDLDRYLEETRRRRQQDENRPVIIAEVVPEPAPRVEPERRRPSIPPRAPAPRGERRPSRVQPVAIPEPTRRAPVLPEIVRPILLGSAPVVVPVPEPSLPPTLASAPHNPGANPRNEASPAGIDSRSRAQKRADASALLIELTRLFRTKQGMAAALVLQEILGRPVSQRRR